MSWLFDNIHIVAVIGFFIISALVRRGKNPEEGKSPYAVLWRPRDHPARPGGSRPQRPEARRVQTTPQVSRPAPVQESTRIERMDEEEMDTGNGYSLEHQEIDRARREEEMRSRPDSIDHRLEMMERDLNRIHSNLNRMTIALPETVVESRDEDHEQSRGSGSFLAEQARNGIVWAEILGTPRASAP